MDFAELASDTTQYLGQLAYLQLAFFQLYSEISSDSKKLFTTEALAAPAGFALAKHEAVMAEIRDRGEDPQQLMGPFTVAIDRLMRIARGQSINEGLLGMYVTQGFLDDFFLGLAARLPKDLSARMGVLLSSDSGAGRVHDLLATAIAEDPRRAHRLALSGRRLVGDILLVGYEALNVETVQNSTLRIEPVVTELITRHTQRMDALGLTA